MKLDLLTPPANEPVSLEELRDHGRIDVDTDDATLAALIVSARTVAETYLRRALIAQTWRLTLDCFPDGNRVTLPKGVLSVTSVITSDEADVSSTFDAASYLVSTGALGAIVLKDAASWPTVTRPVDGVEIVYIAGFGADWNAVPEPVRLGIEMLALHMYENRGDDPATSARLAGAEDLWAPYRKILL